MVYEPRDVGVGMVYNEVGIDAWDKDRSGTIRMEVGGGPAAGVVTGGCWG